MSKRFLFYLCMFLATGSIICAAMLGERLGIYWMCGFLVAGAGFFTALLGLYKGDENGFC